MSIFDSYPNDNRCGGRGYILSGSCGHAPHDPCGEGCADHCCARHNPCENACCHVPHEPCENETCCPCRPEPDCPPPAPTLLHGVQLQLKSGTSVAANAPVLFDAVVRDCSNAIAYEPDTGEVHINRPGNYYVSWSVNLHETTAGKRAFALTLNGTKVATVDAWLERGQICGAALVTVTGRSVVQLVNAATGAAKYDTDTTILANLVIVQAG
ncbi:MAG: hypothetical protein PHS97_03040 [Oscillospiraceae bacterium]|nr:hypothetical protein [Oscillospiraceae bacterium]